MGSEFTTSSDVDPSSFEPDSKYLLLSPNPPRLQNRRDLFVKGDSESFNKKVSKRLSHPWKRELVDSLHDE